MSINSTIRMALAGLTAVALLGGVMAADPADAGKKRKKNKKTNITKVVQVNRSGDARGGDGGHGGKGGDIGKVVNPGDVTGGPFGPFGPFGPDLAPGLLPGEAGCILAAFRAAGNPNADELLNTEADVNAVLAAAVTCGAPTEVILCLEVEAVTPAPFHLNQGEVIGCLRDGVPGGGVPGGDGDLRGFRTGVLSGDGGAGGPGGAGGNATTGAVRGNNNASVIITK